MSSILNFLSCGFYRWRQKPLPRLRRHTREDYELYRKGIRVKPLPSRPALSSRRLTDTGDALQQAFARQSNSSLLHKLPPEVRLMIYEHGFGGREILIGLCRFYSDEVCSHMSLDGPHASHAWRSEDRFADFWPRFEVSRNSHLSALLLTSRAT